MLVSRSLFFARLDMFEDPFEGVPPPAVVEALRRPGHPESAEATRRGDTWKQMIELCSTSICASCRHLGDEKSEAMGKLYRRFEDGMAIVTSLPAIRASFRDHDVAGGLVDYSGRAFEAGTAEQNLLQWATTKRPSYRHENEFRLLAKREAKAGSNDDADGIALPVDPEALVENVVLSPRMERWQIVLFRDLMPKLDFKRPVRESSLLISRFRASCAVPTR